MLHAVHVPVVAVPLLPRQFCRVEHLLHQNPGNAQQRVVQHVDAAVQELNPRRRGGHARNRREALVELLRDAFRGLLRRAEELVEPSLVRVVLVLDEPALLRDHPRSHEIVVLVKLAELAHHTLRALTEDLVPHRDAHRARVDELLQVIPSGATAGAPSSVSECSRAAFACVSLIAPRDALIESVREHPPILFICDGLLGHLELRLSPNVANRSLFRPAQRGELGFRIRQRGRQVGQDTVQRLRG